MVKKGMENRGSFGRTMMQALELLRLAKGACVVEGIRSISYDTILQRVHIMNSW